MGRVKYICHHCSYKFSRSTETEFKLCPYCGKQGTVTIDKEDSATRLLSGAI